MLFSFVTLKWKIVQHIHVFLIGFEYPQQQEHEEYEEDHQGYKWKYPNPGYFFKIIYELHD